MPKEFIHSRKPGTELRLCNYKYYEPFGTSEEEVTCPKCLEGIQRLNRMLTEEK